MECCFENDDLFPCYDMINKCQFVRGDGVKSMFEYLVCTHIDIKNLEVVNLSCFYISGIHA